MPHYTNVARFRLRLGARHGQGGTGSGRKQMGKSLTLFRADIEGLRAIAVLAVVAFHFGISALSGGFVGVDVFFVISGYLITGILLSELETTGRLDLWRFYGRRARRLLPASLLVTIVTLAAGLILLSPAEQLFAAKGALASSLYASNFWFMTFATDYFAAESASNPFLHTWSLAVEEQFYLLWPTLLMILWRFKPSSKVLAWVLAILVAGSFSLCLWLTFRKQPWAFYASPARAWEFGVGALAVLRPVTAWAVRSRGSVPLGWLGMAVLGVTLFALGEDSGFPGWVAVLPALATAAILVSGASGQTGSPAAFLRLSVPQWVGRHSYSIYLWHWPIVVYATISGITSPGMKFLVCSLLTICCAALSFRLLEHPVRSSAWLASRPFRSIGLGASLTLAGAVVALGTARAAALFSDTPAQAAIIQWTRELPIASGSGQGCLIGFVQATPVLCTFGAANPTKTILLFGDSHADQWSTPLARLAESERWQLVTLLKSSCAVADIPTYNIRLRRFLPECTEWRSRAIAEIERLHPDLVIVTQFSSGYVRGSVTTLGDKAVTHEEWAAGLERSISRLRKMEIPLLLLRDSPSPGHNASVCVARSLWRGLPETRCDTLREAALDQQIWSRERGIVASTPGVFFADLSEQFCGPVVCPAMRAGLLVYRDANHMTAAFADAQMSALKAAVLPALQE